MIARGFLFLVLLIACVQNGEQRTVLEIFVDDRFTLTLHEGENPCKALYDLCRNTTEEVDKACFAMAHQLLTRQLTAAWSHFSTRLSVDADIFTNCEPIEYDRSLFDITDSAERNYITEAMPDLLGILQTDDKKTSIEFDVRRNDLRMTDEEQLQLYKQAILLEPNHPRIVSQFGITLLAVEREDLARAVFSDAVNRGIWEKDMQRPVNYYVPGLTSQPWYDPDDFSFPQVLEEGYADIRKELIEMTAGGDSFFYTEAENQNTFNFDGSWKTLILKEWSTYTDIAKQNFPKTIEWLDKCKEEFLLVKFSALEPGTHIRPHTGPSNEKLRSHFTLVHTGGAQIRVGNEWRTWEEKKTFIFDSSWEHEVIHEGPDRRIVLILDIWHPDVDQ